LDLTRFSLKVNSHEFKLHKQRKKLPKIYLFSTKYALGSQEN
jgi:hypothetical protein